MQEKGFRDFKYFGLKSKHKLLSINNFQEFFASNFGKQLLSLSYSSDISTKKFIEMMYIPKSFLSITPLPVSLEQAFDKLLKADNLEGKFEIYHEMRNNLVNCTQAQRASSIHALSNLKKILEKSANKISPIEDIAFLKKIASLEKVNITKHPELFLQISSPSSLNSTLSYTKITQSENIAELKLFSSEGQIAAISGPNQLVQFSAYLFNLAANYPLQKILKAISIPSYNEFSVFFKEFQQGYIEKKKNLQLINSDINLLIKKSL